MQLPLSTRLREATRALHIEVERAGVMRLLLRGQLGLADYCALLRNLHAIYDALEAGIQTSRNHAGLTRLGCASMFRSAALASDLTTLHGGNWAVEIGLVPAAESYARHLKAQASNPILLAAHAYVRYLGDLSGGQMLVRVVAQSLALQPGEGVHFYNLGSSEVVAQLAGQFRSGLDLLVDTEADAQAIIDEACAAFVRHRDLFEQLA